MLFKYFALFVCIIGTLLTIPALISETNFRNGRKFKYIEDVYLTGISVDDCGSKGIISEVRVSECLAVPCELHPGQSYVIEVDFSTSTNGNLWKVLVTAHAGDSSVIVLDENVEAEIVAGDEHTLQYELPVTDLFAGLDIKVQIQLIEVNTQVEEICISADAFVVIPEESSTPETF